MTHLRIFTASLCLALCLSQITLAPLAEAKARGNVKQFQKSAKYQEMQMKIQQAQKKAQEYTTTASVAAAPAIALAPAAVMATAEALICVVAALVFFGIVDEITGNRLTAPLHQLSRDMSNLISRGVEMCEQASVAILVTSIEGILALKDAVAWLDSTVISWMNAELATYRWAKAVPKTAVEPATITHIASMACTPPQSCCPKDWNQIKKLGEITSQTQKFVTRIINNSTVQFFSTKLKGGKLIVDKLACCYEWDRFHGNHFEVFGPGGQYQGEHFCSNEEPCNGKVAGGKTGIHAPRTCTF